MKRAMLAAVAGLVLAGGAWAQSMGPGMMGGGYGPGGYGGYGQGYGMMHGGGYGMGGYGMGPGMMGGYGYEAYANLGLSAEQRKKITDIQRDASKAMWQLMGTMHEQGYPMHGMFGPGPLDEAAARKAYQTMTETHKAMFELQLESRKRVEAVLTKEQRDKLSR
jgi:Spy/CpxP family protein refolding chaperone